MKTVVQNVAEGDEAGAEDNGVKTGIAEAPEELFFAVAGLSAAKGSVTDGGMGARRRKGARGDGG